MAIQNSTITVKGKLGNIVGYKGRKGQRLARIRQTEVKNPKTVAQTIQRLIIATVSRAYSRMKTIVDHSFEGITYGSPTQAEFLKQAANDLRTYFAANYPKFQVTDQKELKGLSWPNNAMSSGIGLMISRGTLQSIPAEVVSGNLVFGAALSDNTIADVMAAVGAKKGDQITICGLSYNEWFESRYIINNDATDDQLKVTWDPTGAADAYDAQTSVGDHTLIIDNSRLVVEDCTAYCVILSRKEGNKWLRSTQRLFSVDSAEVWEGEEDELPANVLLAWMEGTTPIETENPYYLNQAEQAGE